MVRAVAIEMVRHLRRSPGFALTFRDRLSSGHFACPGCGAILGLRMAVQALAPDCVFVIPACCMAVADGPFPMSALGVPLYHCAFAATAPTAAGIVRALRRRGDERTVVVGWAGDGGTLDIGLSGVSAAAARNEDIIFVCYDNEAYMNTGIQQSSATPEGAWTTTSPVRMPKQGPKKDPLLILWGHKVPYLASANPAYPQDMVLKFKTAQSIRGFRFIHLFSSCPPGHKSEEANTVKISRLAVECRVFPLYEIREGRMEIYEPCPPKPVEEYLQLQGRFRHWDEGQIRRFQDTVDKHWEWLKALKAFINRGREGS